LQYHDYHLQGYEVADFGRTVTLNLVYDYAGRPRRESTIQYSQVMLYHFEHPTSAIITHIEEIPLAEILEELRTQIIDWARMHGVTGWRTDFDQYSQWLVGENKKAWRIESAIGFYGIVIAGSVEQIVDGL
jgi:hypothetical protein